MRGKYRFVAAMLFAVAFCSGVFVWIYQMWQEPAKNGEITVAASFYPVYIAARNVAGACEGIEIKSLSEPQTGCLHDFQLTPEDMKLLSKADLFLVNGGGMEQFLEDAAGQYPALPIVEIADDAEMLEENAHVWMSVKRYRSQVAKITEALCEIAGEYAKELKENARAYDMRLDALEKQQEKMVKAAAGSKVILFHEAYAYLADDYEIEVAYSINLDEERQVSAGEVAEVLDAIDQEGVRIIFAEELYGRALAETVQKEADVFVYYLDTLVRGEDDPDSYCKGMQENIKILQQAFGVEAS